LRNSFRNARGQLEPVSMITVYSSEGGLDENITNQDARFFSLMKTGVLDCFEKDVEIRLSTIPRLSIHGVRCVTVMINAFASPRSSSLMN